jgi:hypothetical protein
MTTVTFTGLYLTALADETDTCSFSVNDLEYDLTTYVTVRPNALGEQRAVSTPGVATGAKVALNFCTDAQTAWLKAHQGQPVWYRDGYGQKFAAFYTPDSGYQPRPKGNSWAVPVTFAGYTQPDVL